MLECHGPIGHLACLHPCLAWLPGTRARSIASARCAARHGIHPMRGSAGRRLLATPARLHATNPGRARCVRCPECCRGPNRSPNAAWWEPNPFTGFAAAGQPRRWGACRGAPSTVTGAAQADQCRGCGTGCSHINATRFAPPLVITRNESNWAMECIRPCGDDAAGGRAPAPELPRPRSAVTRTLGTPTGRPPRAGTIRSHASRRGCVRSCAGAPVAQGIERGTSNPEVAGSNPAGGASLPPLAALRGRRGPGARDAVEVPGLTAAAVPRRRESAP